MQLNLLIRSFFERTQVLKLRDEEIKNLVEANALRVNPFIFDFLPYRQIFDIRKITKYHINLFLGIEFYFGRLENISQAILVSKDSRYKRYAELKAKLEELEKNPQIIHERIAREGIDAIDKIFAEKEAMEQELLELEKELFGQ